jgi:Tol biopolymer transport system component
MNLPRLRRQYLPRGRVRGGMLCRMKRMRTCVAAFLALMILIVPAAEFASATAGPPRAELTFLRIKQLGPVPYDVREGIFEMRPDGTSLHRILKSHGVFVHLGSWSPGGTQLVFSEADTHLGPCHVEIVNADGSGLHSIRDSGIVRCDVPLDWSPDGKTILFERGLNLFTMSVKGAHVTQLTHFHRARSYLDGAGYSPDGSSITFARETPRGVGHIFVMNASGVPMTRITSCDSRLCLGGSRDEDPQWSPDGKMILFDRERNLFTVRPSGTGLTRLTNCVPTYRYSRCTAYEGYWSPDGSHIAFDRRGRLHVMKAEGANVTRVGPRGAFDPLWRDG